MVPQGHTLVDGTVVDRVYFHKDPETGDFFMFSLIFFQLLMT